MAGGALADYDAAIRLRPASADAYCNRGLVHRRAGDFAAATTYTTGGSGPRSVTPADFKASIANALQQGAANG